MSYERHETALDYYPCSYGGSRTLFRGPKVGLEKPYTVVIGGSEAYGKYVEDPFCDRVTDMTGRRVVNLGLPNAGIDVFARDDDLMQVIGGAEIAVIQIMGAGNISNRFYSVHPRRNDRFLRHSILMETLFHDVDFSDFSFTRHLLRTLREASPDRFAMVLQELGEAWVARMRLLLSRIPGRKVLLWIENGDGGDLGPEPLFVTPEMMQKLEPLTDVTIRCDVLTDLREEPLTHLIFPELERAAALRSLSCEGHERVACALARAIGNDS
ncbi:MAG: DUF6473 family protein [Jannaschia sp.]